MLFKGRRLATYLLDYLLRNCLHLFPFRDVASVVSNIIYKQTGYGGSTGREHGTHRSQ
jgi:hypothetical protein